jgi:hypothetical protein
MAPAISFLPDVFSPSEVDMLMHRTWATTMMMIAISPILAASCSSTVGGGGAGGDGGGGSTASSGGSDLKWFTTCGDPVCDSNTTPDSPVCTTEKAGDACSQAGQTCGLPDGCGADLLCTTTDPTMGGNCPISRASYKHDIRYLPDGELTRIHDELVAMPLTTWRYNHEGASGREHLGFIIDDNPKSPAVAASGNQVDLYGYMSMAVAAIQVQEKQIEALEHEMKALREELRAARRGPRR